MPEFDDEAVKQAFLAFPSAERQILLRLRDMIFEIAEQTDGVGQIEECLKWGQPSYLTHKPKSGTTIRLGGSRKGQAAIFTHCQTSVVADFAAMFGDSFEIEGNRAVIFSGDQPKQFELIGHLIKHALTYHQK